MTASCTHTWEPFTRWKAKCRQCKHARPWVELVREVGWSDGRRRHPLTAAEVEIVGLVVEQVRNATADRVQLSMLFDPFTLGGGAHICFSHSSAGFSVTVEGDIRSKRAPSARRTRSRR